jgi:hypothetical protein
MSMPAYINIAIWPSQGYVDLFPSEQEARTHARDRINTTVSELNNLFLFRNTQFRVIFFPNSSYAPNQGVGDNTFYNIQLSNAFKQNWPCVVADIVVVPVTGSGHGFGFSDVSKISRGALNDPRKVAHEIGHVLGLVHLEGNCGTHCSQPSTSTFMCTTAGAIEFASCDLTRLTNDVYTSSNCNRWMDVVEPFPDNFICPSVELPTISFDTDQLYPIKGCTPDKSMPMYTLTVSGGSAGVSDLKIRARYRKVIWDIDIPTMGLDFNNELTNDPNWNVLRIFENGSEKSFNLAPFEKKTVHFQLAFNPDPGIIVSNGNVFVDGQMIIGNQTTSVSSKQRAVKKITGGTVNQISNGDPIFLEGNVTFSGPLFLSTPLILMGEGAAINLAASSNVQPGLIPTVFEGCTKMWRGIRLANNSVLNLENETIKDAQYGVQVVKGSTLIAKNCNFTNNNISVSTLNQGSGNYNITMLGNRFHTNSNGLRPAYSGQSPAPLSTGYAGIYVKNVSTGLNIDEFSTIGSANLFSNLRYGIIAENTNLLVRHSEFRDMQPGGSPAGYPGPLLSGIGIYASGGQVRVQGGEGPEVSFTNAYAGIQTVGASLYATQCRMQEVRNGILVRGGYQNGYYIAWNEIEASDRGIGLFFQSGLPGAGLVESNKITLSGNPQGAGIHVGGTEMFPHTDGLLLHNRVDLLDGGSGIYLGATQKLRATRNTVTTSAAGQTGLRLEGGRINTLNCNDVSGAGNAGIYAVHADLASLLCNTTAGAATGLHFEGMLSGLRKADIAGNTMRGHQTGMRYGVSAITGSQAHRGNKWPDAYNDPGTFGAKHEGLIDIALFSTYIVDDQENDQFLPNGLNGVDPENWFINDPNTSLSYSCIPSQSCPLEAAVAPEPRLDTLTARGELPGGPYTALNNWLGRRRLYARIQQEGNTYPGVPAVEQFLTSAATNGLHDYYLADQALQAVFSLDSADANTLAALEQQSGQLLDSLKTLESQLHAYGVSEQDSAAFAAAREAVRVALDQTDASRTALLAQLQADRNTAAGQAASQIGALVGTVVYEQYDKAVSDILLRSLAGGTPTFTPADIDSLQTIAHACPLACGDAVLRARALLALADTVPAYYDDELLCNAQPRNNVSSAAAPAAENWVRVRPNPARDLLYISASGEADLNFQLYNAAGLPLRSLVLPAAGGQQMLDVSALPLGIYWYRAWDTEGRVQTGKVVISR